MKRLILILTALVLGILPVYAEVSIESVYVTPQSPLTTDTLDCGFKILGNETSYTADVTWKVDGADHVSDNETITAQHNQTVSTGSSGDIEPADTTKGEQWICVVTATDSLNNTDTKESAVVIIGNTAPKITSVPPVKAFTGEAYQYAVKAEDADGDDLAFALESAPENMTISDSGLIQWTPSEEQDGTYTVKVVVTDTSDAAANQTFTITSIRQKLVVDKLSAKCSPRCDDDNLDEETGGSIEEVRPGATLELEIKLKNIWADGTDDHDIEDIEIETTLEDMGDEDEQDEDEDINRIKPDDKEKVILTYEIPEEVDEDTYSLDVDISGEDEDGTVYKISFTIDVEVEKEDHQMIFTRAVAQPAIISCDREFDIRIGIKNIGAKDEDNAQVVIKNTALDISDYDIFTVDSTDDYDDEDSEYYKDFTFIIGDDVKEGVYNIDVRAYYEDDDEYEATRIPITVRDCIEKTAPVEQPENEEKQAEKQDEEEDSKEEVEVIEQPVTQIIPPTQTSGPAVAQPIAKNTRTESFFDSDAFLIMLALTVLVLFVLVITLAVVAFRK